MNTWDQDSGIVAGRDHWGPGDFISLPLVDAIPTLPARRFGSGCDSLYETMSVPEAGRETCMEGYLAGAGKG